MANELERGKRTIREYLSEVSDMSTLNNRRVFKIIVDEFETKMKNENYFNEIATFLNRRKPKKEKDEFCFNIVKDIVHSIDVKAIYASKYPDAFNIIETTDAINTMAPEDHHYDAFNINSNEDENTLEEISAEDINFYINNF